MCQMTREGIPIIYKILQVIYNKEEAAQKICLIENVYGILTRFVGIKGMEHSAEGAPKRMSMLI